MNTTRPGFDVFEVQIHSNGNASTRLFTSLKSATSFVYKAAKKKEGDGLLFTAMESIVQNGFVNIKQTHYNSNGEVELIWLHQCQVFQPKEAEEKRTQLPEHECQCNGEWDDE